MKYTTLIDISELPAIYRNVNARLLYLHMALRAGYHDEDRDIVDASIRNLSASTGITLSACRHALRVLEAAQLLRRDGDVWIVKKWLPAQSISPRKKEPSKDAAHIEEERKRRDAQERREQRERQKADEDLKRGKTQFMLYYESLQQKAAQGDQEAARLLRGKEATYLQHKKAMDERMNNNKTETK